MFKLPNLERIRRRKLLTQEELAGLAGVSKLTIHRLERAGISARADTIKKLATALEVEPAELIGEEQLA